MEDMYKDPFRNNNLRAKRTPSKVVSEAFGFLNNKSYADGDGLVRIHCSYSESRLATMDRSENSHLEDLHTDVYIPDEDEFTIITTVDKSPQPKHRVSTGDQSCTQIKDETNQESGRRESLPDISTTGYLIPKGLNNGITCKAEEKPVASKNDSAVELDKTNNHDKEFTIVTYIEDYNKRKISNDKTHVVNTVTDSSKKTVEPNDRVEVTGEEKRKSLNIEGEVVELRSPVRNSTPVRAPTWRQNQMIVSEAFNFLQDLEGGDTISVIAIPAEEKDDDNKRTDNNLGSTMTAEKNLSEDKEDDVNKSAKTSSENDKLDTMKTLENKPKLNTFGKPVSPILPSLGRRNSDSSPERFSTNTEKDDQLGELGPSKLRQRRRTPKKDSEDDDDADSSDEDRGRWHIPPDKRAELR